MYLYYYSLLLWTICIFYIGFVRIDGLIGCFMISGHIQRYLSFSKSDYFKYVFIIHGIYYFLKTRKLSNDDLCTHIQEIPVISQEHFAAASFLDQRFFVSVLELFYNNHINSFLSILFSRLLTWILCDIFLMRKKTIDPWLIILDASRL